MTYRCSRTTISGSVVAEQLVDDYRDKTLLDHKKRQSFRLKDQGCFD